MSKTLILTVLFLFTLLFLLVSRWKEILLLWKSTWGKIIFMVLLCTFIFFNAYDIFNKTNSNDSSVQTIIDSLDLKDKRITELITKIATRVDNHNDSIINYYKKFGPTIRSDTENFDRLSIPLMLSNVPQIFYLSEYDVALVITLENRTSKPAFIGNFKSFQVDIIDSLIKNYERLSPKNAIKKAEDKSAVRIGQLKELPSFISEYQIIVFIHSAVKVNSLKKRTLVYITSLTGNNYCDGQSLVFIWNRNGMIEQPLFKNPICEYLNEHLPILNKKRI